MASCSATKPRDVAPGVSRSRHTASPKLGCPSRRSHAAAMSRAIAGSSGVRAGSARTATMEAEGSVGAWPPPTTPKRRQRRHANRVVLRNALRPWSSACATSTREPRPSCARWSTRIRSSCLWPRSSRPNAPTRWSTRSRPRYSPAIPTAADLAAANPLELEELVHSTGFFRSKAKNLIGMGDALDEPLRRRGPDGARATS